MMLKNDNLSKLTKEQLSENGKKGGIASGKSKQAKKAMREELEAILNLPVKKSVKGKVNKLLTVDTAKAIEDFQRENTTMQTQILLKLTTKAASGDLKAIQLISDIMIDKKMNLDVNAEAKVQVKEVDSLAEDLFGED